MGFINDWHIPSETQILAILNETGEFAKELAEKEPDQTRHTGRANRRTRRNRSAKGELYADDSGTTSKSFDLRQAGSLSIELYNKNQPVVGYLEALEREVISDETVEKVDRKFSENMEKLLNVS